MCLQGGNFLPSHSPWLSPYGTLVITNEHESVKIILDHAGNSTIWRIVHTEHHHRFRRRDCDCLSFHCTKNLGIFLAMRNCLVVAEGGEFRVALNFTVWPANFSRHSVPPQNCQTHQGLPYIDVEMDYSRKPSFPLKWGESIVLQLRFCT